MEQRTCKVCGVPKPVGQFRSTGLGRRQKTCLACVAAADRATKRARAAAAAETPARRLGSLTPEFRPQDGHDPVGCSVGRTLPLFRVASAEDQDRWRHLADVGMAWCVLCYPELQADEPPVVAA